MVGQSLLDDKEAIGLARALSVPVLALLLAVLLILTASPQRQPFSALRTLAILFGLSCLPGGLIGVALGYLIDRNSKLTAGLLETLRIGQWAPFVMWWVLLALLLAAPDQNLGRYFFVWTMSIPVVTLGACYEFLRTRYVLERKWQVAVSQTAKLSVFRSLFISLVLSLSVWVDQWYVVPDNINVANHYVVTAVLALFLFFVNLTYRSGIDQSAALHREVALAEFSRRSDGSTWTAALILLFFITVWQLFSFIGYFKVSPVSAFDAAASLFSEPEIRKDMLVSLLEILAGVLFSGVLAIIVSATLVRSTIAEQWMLPVLSLTFVIPMVMLPAWHGWILSLNKPPFLFLWTAICVACLSFFPAMQAVWAFRVNPQLYTILLTADHALPYGFAAMLYGEMMSATDGLGLAVVVASATYQIERAFAIFLITLSLLFAMSLALRLLARTLYFFGMSSTSVAE
jgi:ABC-type nitrate/sulfonate/bicarbonate transport system permease component